jgi:hypothetical protein
MGLVDKLETTEKKVKNKDKVKEEVDKLKYYDMSGMEHS